MPDEQSLITGQTITELPASADVVIIGGGIVGAASAFWLARSGRTPVILEREAGLATVTTSSSAHCIRAQFSEPENIAMMSESLGYFERFADLLDVSPEVGSIALQQQGYLFATTKPEERPDFEFRVARQQSMGLADVELLDGEEIRYRWPWLSVRNRLAALSGNETAGSTAARQRRSSRTPQRRQSSLEPRFWKLNAMDLASPASAPIVGRLPQTLSS